jgi:hypothetical protein
MTARLSEFEDRMLATCEGDWIDLDTGQDGLESWFAEKYSDDKFRDSLARLLGTGLVIRRDCDGTAPSRATEKGESVLAEMKPDGN